MSVRQRLFTGLVRLGKLSEMASQAFLFLGVGLLRRSDFKDLSLRSWSAYAHTDEEARSGFTTWEETSFRQFVKPGDRLCVVGCGSGRDLLPFVSEGHDASASNRRLRRRPCCDESSARPICPRP